jgi:hypothetical protein
LGAMFASDLHVMIAVATLAAIVVVTGEAAVRLVQGRPPGRLASRGLTVVLILALMAAAGGLALLVGGHRPKEWWHVMYAGFALAMIPLADSIALRAAARWKALARLIGGLVALEVIVRLFQTG